MEDVKRGRGRPKGTETDDSVPLMAVARLLTDEPKLAAKTAMRRVFRSGKWGRSSEDASLHRWQGKWNAVSAIYMQRVHDERAEAERLRQERARQANTRTAWELMDDMRRSGHLPSLTISSTFRDAFAQHSGFPRSSASWQALAEANGMPKMEMTAFDMFADARRSGTAISEAVLSLKSVLDTPGLGEALRKTGGFEFTSEQIGAVLPQMPKLPKGLGNP